MKAKLEQMDAWLRDLSTQIDDDTVLIVMGDHGMDEKGDHGGESDDEVEAALWMYSKRPFFGRTDPNHVQPPATGKERPPSAAVQQPTESKEASQAATEWQSVSDSKRQNRPQSISGPPTENKDTLGYVKYVTDKVKTEDLRAALAAHGELTYFDVNRQKNCAFVEFATAAGYQAAAAANPHTVNGETIHVEARRPKAGAYGGSNYASGRGGAPSRGRGGFEGQRQGSQGGGRGNFTGGQGR
ncbi:hypothetical protein BN1723_018203, partial [Verticillium longisporum]